MLSYVPENGEKVFDNWNTYQNDFQFTTILIGTLSQTSTCMQLGL